VAHPLGIDGEDMIKNYRSLAAHLSAAYDARRFTIDPASNDVHIIEGELSKGK
jgi:hypothetical protein